MPTSATRCPALRPVPGPYWRDLDRRMEYPKAFVDALTQAGYLSILIPEEYGGSGLPLSAAAAVLEEIQRSGCNGGACHAQMYTMGTLLRHGSPEQKQAYLPAIAEGRLRLQAFGVTEPSSGTDTALAQDDRPPRRGSFRRAGAEDLDQPRRALGPDAAAGPHHAAGARHEAHRRPLRPARRHAHGARTTA